MSLRAPTSYAKLAFRLSPADVAIAVLSPPLALYLRHADPWSSALATPALFYWLVSLASSLIAFVAFGVSRAVPGYVSLHELGDLAKAVVTGEVIACAVVFSITRLDGVPRSTPFIHVLFLGAGVFTARFVADLVKKNHKLARRGAALARSHVILVGATDLASIYMTFLEACASPGQSVIALLDEDPGWTGRSFNGVRVCGTPADLEPLIEEFEVHGVRTDRVILGLEENEIAPQALFSLGRVCARRAIEFVHLPRLFGAAAVCGSGALAEARGQSEETDFPLPRYFAFKRAFDLFVAALAAPLLLPLLVLAGALAFVDVGSPILFWQQRVGKDGRSFSLHKIRTLRPIFDWRGERIPEERRLSPLGRFLRRARLDELPQLWNVLAGEMSLVGPRPLLERDQPPRPKLRLRVRPGITGWAQVRGGILLSPREKEELDAWYIGNASLALDLRILALTCHSLLRGDRRSPQALLLASAQKGAASGKKSALPRKKEASRPSFRGAGAGEKARPSLP